MTTHCDCGACDPELLALAAEHDEVTTVVHVWPDGAWCEPEDLAGMTHRSDDYATIECLTDSIEECVERYLNK